MRVARIDSIEEYILKKKSVTLDELCEKFQVSKNTLRRDIDALVKKGNISKVYGGVVAKEKKSAVGLRSFDERNSMHLDLKEQIAARAASLISSGDTLFIDTGSSTLPLIPHLAKLNNVTIITNSIPVIYSALNYPSLNVIGLPGTLNHSTDSLVGASCLDSLKNFHVKKAIMSCTGVSLSHGICNASFAEFEIKKAAVSLADEVILLADSSKFGVTSMMSYAQIDQLDYVVTDSLPDAVMQGYFQDKKVKILA